MAGGRGVTRSPASFYPTGALSGDTNNGMGMVGLRYADPAEAGGGGGGSCAADGLRYFADAIRRAGRRGGASVTYERLGNPRVTTSLYPSRGCGI